MTTITRYGLDVDAQGSGFNAQISAEDYDRVNSQLQGRASINLFLATLFPVRTNNLKNFAADFFLPTTINQVLEIHNIGIKILALIPAVLLDLVTLRIRLVTCIPRAIYNAWQGLHPLHDYFRTFNDIMPPMEFAQVHLHRQREESIPYTQPDGTVLYCMEPQGSFTDVRVNFIEMPDTTLVQRVNEAIERYFSS